MTETPACLVPWKIATPSRQPMRDLVEDGAKAAHLALKAKERAQRHYSVRAVADRYAQLNDTLLAR